MVRFSGTGVALVTPFQNGNVDLDSLADIVEHVIRGGVDFLVVLGTTGESVTLTEQERRSAIDKVIDVNNGRKPIVAGNFGSNNTLGLCDYIRNYNFDGIDAILSSSPAYNKPGQEGIFQHYKAIADTSPVPVIAYNVPGRTASNISADTTLRITEQCPNIIGIKEASGDMIQGSQILKDDHGRFLVLSGDDPTALSLIQLGAHGAISVVANLYPSIMSNMINSALRKDYEVALAAHHQLLDLHPLLYAEGNPAGIKAAMQCAGLCSDEVRLPLTPATDSLKRSIAAELERINNP